MVGFLSVHYKEGEKYLGPSAVPRLVDRKNLFGCFFPNYDQHVLHLAYVCEQQKQVPCPKNNVLIFLFRYLKSIRVHSAPAEIAITLELLSQFLRFLDQNDRHSLGVLLIY